MKLNQFSGVRLSDADILGPFWQREPCWLTQAVDVSQLQLNPNDLIDIITETDLPSRLITGAEGGQFTLQRGPFDAFNPPSDRPWTVLIQAIEQLIPEFAALRSQLHWIPDWRFEDCMVSWASAGGSVGRHLDQFSVFLVQLTGRREWQVGPRSTESTVYLPDQPLALVEVQPPVETRVAEPGDVLYLPPGVIHHGVALDADCMTLSIGFRAPSTAELIESLLEGFDERTEHCRFNDAGRGPSINPAEITDRDIARVRDAIMDALDPEQLAHLLAERVTQPYLDLEPTELESDADCHAILAACDTLVLDAGIRVAYFDDTLYLNGALFGQNIPTELVELANRRQIKCARIQSLGSPWSKRLIELIRLEQLIPAEDGH